MYVFDFSGANSKAIFLIDISHQQINVLRYHQVSEVITKTAVH